MSRCGLTCQPGRGQERWLSAAWGGSWALPRKMTPPPRPTPVYASSNSAQIQLREDSNFRAFRALIEIRSVSPLLRPSARAHPTQGGSHTPRPALLSCTISTAPSQPQPRQLRTTVSSAGLLNYVPQAQCGPPLVFINKVLLGRSHSHLFTGVCGCLATTMAEWSSCYRGLQSWQYLFSGPSQEQFADHVGSATLFCQTGSLLYP